MRRGRELLSINNGQLKPFKTVVVVRPSHMLARYRPPSIIRDDCTRVQLHGPIASMFRPRGAARVLLYCVCARNMEILFKV